MFEFTVGNWVIIARVLLEDVTEWFIIGTLLYKMVFGFAVIGVLNACFMQETFKVAGNDDRIMIVQKAKSMRIARQKMHALFEAADESGDGTMSEEEFVETMSNV